jgi:hypothetical protein
MRSAYAASVGLASAAVGVLLGHFLPNLGDTAWTAGGLFLCGAALFGLLQGTQRLGSERRGLDRRVSDRRGAELPVPEVAVPDVGVPEVGGPEVGGPEVEEEPQQARTDGAPPLGEMLVSYGLISEANLQKALARQKKRGRRLGQVLVEMRLVTLDQVLAVLQEQSSRRIHGAVQTAPDAPRRRDSETAPAGAAGDCSVFANRE